MAKKPRPGAQPNPAIRLSNLSPRLIRLFSGDPADVASLPAELDRLTDGLKAASFLPIVVGALATMPAAQREPLDAPLSAWLREHGLLEPLHDLEARHTFRDQARGVARMLLETGGLAPTPELVVNPADLFLTAFEFGESSQDSPTLFWHEDARRRRVRSASFLLDFEPPWDGALKDVAYSSHRDLDGAVSDYRIHWQRQGLEPRELDAPTAAQRVWKALRQSQAQGIRLPADFITVMPQILPFLLALPVAPGVEPLTPAELEALATSGRSPESIRREERRFGYQTRMPDGSVIRIVRPPDDEL